MRQSSQLKNSAAKSVDSAFSFAALTVAYYHIMYEAIIIILIGS